MRPNEVMIGNIFQESRTGQIIKVIALTENNVTFSGSFEDGWQAIPVIATEEWLHDFKISQVEFGRCIMIGDYPFLRKAYPYVHQIQNLHYAITGEII